MKIEEYKYINFPYTKKWRRMFPDFSPTKKKKYEIDNLEIHLGSKKYGLGTICT